MTQQQWPNNDAQPHYEQPPQAQQLQHYPQQPPYAQIPGPGGVYGQLSQPPVQEPLRKVGKRRNQLLVAAAIVVAFVIGIAVGGAGGSGNTNTPTAAANVGDDTTTAPATKTSAPAAKGTPAAVAKTTAPATKPATKAPAKPAGPAALLKPFKGNGIKNSPKFTSSSDWVIHYSYNCASFGSKGNFQVMYYTDGELDNVAVNELDKKGSGTEPIYDDAGSHYLSINSECSWTVSVTAG